MNLEEILSYIILGLGIIVLVSALLTLPVYYLWNWLMPKIFGLGKVTLAQALGLNLLASCLFRSSGKKGD